MENLSIGMNVKVKHNRKTVDAVVIGINPNDVLTLSNPNTNTQFTAKMDDVISIVTSEKENPEAEVQTKKKGRTPNGKLSLLDAAALFLKETEEAFTANEIIEKIIEKGLWEKTAAKTPNLSLYSAIYREITAKGQEARFVKASSKGKFCYNQSLQ